MRHFAIQTLAIALGIFVASAHGAAQDENSNETPSLTVTGLVVAEDAASGTVVGQATGTDSDPGDSLTYSLTDDAGGLFAIDAVTGEINLADGKALDYEKAASHSIIVQVSDAGGYTSSQAVTIYVSNTPEFSIFVIKFCPDVPKCNLYKKALIKTGDIVSEQLKDLLPKEINAVRVPESFEESTKYWQDIKDRWTKNKFDRLIVIDSVAYDKTKRVKDPVRAQLRAWTLGQDFLQKNGFGDLGPTTFSKIFDMADNTPDDTLIRKFIQNQQRARHAFFDTKRVHVGCVLVDNDTDQIGVAPLGHEEELQKFVKQLKDNAENKWKDLKAFLTLADAEGLTGYTFVISQQSVLFSSNCEEAPNAKNAKYNYLIEGTMESLDSIDESIPDGDENILKALIKVVISSPEADYETKEFDVLFNFRTDKSVHAAEFNDISCKIAKNWLAADKPVDGQAKYEITCQQQGPST